MLEAQEVLLLLDQLFLLLPDGLLGLSIFFLSLLSQLFQLRLLLLHFLLFAPELTDDSLREHGVRIWVRYLLEVPEPLAVLFFGALSKLNLVTLLRLVIRVHNLDHLLGIRLEALTKVHRPLRDLRGPLHIESNLVGRRHTGRLPLVLHPLELGHLPL